jgi:hypothetical protein
VYFGVFLVVWALRLKTKNRAKTEEKALKRIDLISKF